MGSLQIDDLLWTGESPVTSLTLLQRLQVNRSPIESPPVAKKLLKSMQFLPSSSSSAASTLGSPGKENRSILKRIGPAGTRAKSWPSATSKRVNFEHNVVVVVYDREGGDYVCSENQELNVEPKDRREFVGRTLLGRLQSSRASTVRRPASEHIPVGRTPVADTNNTPLPNPAEAELQSEDVDFTFFEDANGRLRLKFTVVLGPGVQAGDALVKANVTGNKVRILGTRTLPGVPPVRQEFGMRYSLPMDVDPYEITARMDSSGNLYVEAPVLTGERRRILAMDKAKKSTTVSSPSSRLSL